MQNGIEDDSMVRVSRGLYNNHQEALKFKWLWFTANLNGEGNSTPRWGLGKTRGNRDVSFYKWQQERVVDSEGRMNALFQPSANRQMHSFCMSQGWLGGACPWHPHSMHSCNFSGDGCFAEVYIVLPRDKRTEYLGGPLLCFQWVYHTWCGSFSSS